MPRSGKERREFSKHNNKSVHFFILFNVTIKKFDFDKYLDEQNG